MTDPASVQPSLLYSFGVQLVRFLLWAGARATFAGAENVPRSGPLMVVSNHLCYADPPILATLIPRHIVFMAKEELFRWPLRPITLWYGGFPVRRGSADRKAIRTALALLEHGLALGMFPEGTRSRSRRLGEGQMGAGLLALRSGASILPVGIAGTDALRSPLSLLRRPCLSIKIGQAFTVGPYPDASRSMAVAQATETIMARIEELLPPEHRPIERKPLTRLRRAESARRES